MGEKYIMNCNVIILCLKHYQKGGITENEMGSARSTHGSERGRRERIHAKFGLNVCM